MSQSPNGKHPALWIQHHWVNHQAIQCRRARLWLLPIWLHCPHPKWLIKLSWPSLALFLLLPFSAVPASSLKIFLDSDPKLPPYWSYHVSAWTLHPTPPNHTKIHHFEYLHMIQFWLHGKNQDFFPCLFVLALKGLKIKLEDSPWWKFSSQGDIKFWTQLFEYSMPKHLLQHGKGEI